ncbi:MAG: threonylcarbamoyl-AMP synthase [Clostridia bacterium]|nr:threonylcarbamoyl-AMP synthase [Clostridia bacterium]
MNTLHLKAMDEKAVNEIEKAAEIIKNGGLVAIPTETVYGLAASAFNESAIENIFKAKGRPNDNPLIVHIADIEELYNIVKEVPIAAKQCMDAFWPGPFTAVLPKKDIIPLCVSGGLDTVAVRMPNNAVTKAIIKKAGVPLAAPSANRSGSPSPSSAEHVIDDLEGKIDAIVISEKCEVGVESTVVTFATNPPRLLRPGGITVEMLKEFIPNLIIDSAVTAEPEKGVAVASPGMKYKHYAPKAEVIMATGSIHAFCDYCNAHKKDFDFALCYDEDEINLSIPHLSLGANEDHEKQAELLFEFLRDIDKKGYKKVIVHAPLREGVGLAVYNRLIRAAGFKVIEL